MTLLDLVILLLIAAVTGSLGQSIAGYSLGGCVVSAIVGFIGAALGLWIARSIGLPQILTITLGGQQFPIIWSIIGSTILSVILGLLTRRKVVYVRR